MTRTFNSGVLLFTALLALSSFAEAAPRGIFPTVQFWNQHYHPGPHMGGPQVLYYGGPVLSNVKTYAVFWGSKVDPTIQKGIGDFLAATVNSSYMDWLKEYNTNINGAGGRHGTDQSIGRGTFAGAIVINPQHTGNKIDDLDIQTELGQQINAHALPEPDLNTIFMIYFPPGLTITIDNMSSCQAFCAYHQGYIANNKKPVFYGVMPDLGGACSLGCGMQNKFDMTTEVSSHELIEAVTDPFPTPGDKPAFPQAWNTIDGNEIGDLCAGKKTRLTTKGQTYILQQEFDNLANGCAPGPYSNP